MSRVVRLADRATGRTVKEYEVTALSPAEIDVWFRTVAVTWDQARYATVWPDHLEEKDTADDIEPRWVFA